MRTSVLNDSAPRIPSAPLEDAARLDELLHLVLAEVNSELPVSLVLTETKWPAQPVLPQLREIARASLLFLVEIAGTGDARLDLRATASPDGGVKLRFSLFLPDPQIPTSKGRVNYDEGAFELLRQMGGDVRLEVSYPYTCLGLRVPSVVAATAAIA